MASVTNKSRLAVCAICGDREATTVDHIPPKNIFPSPRPHDLVTVPACAECNLGASANDEAFRIAIGLIVGADQEVTRRLWDKGVMRTLDHNKKLRRETLLSLSHVKTTNPSSSTHGAWVAALPAEPIQRVVERTVRGLYFHHYRAVLGPRALCFSRLQHIPAKYADRAAEMFSAFKYGSIGETIVQYRYARANESSQFSFWLFSFFDRQLILAWTVPENLKDDIASKIAMPRAKDQTVSH